MNPSIAPRDYVGATKKISRGYRKEESGRSIKDE